MIAGIFLTLIFVSLSTLHWYWVARDAGDLSGFVPEVDGKPTMEPGRLTTAGVAALLLLAAFLCASQAQLLGLPQTPISRVGVWALLVVFLLRAIGDLRLVGFFKKVRNTRFSQLDTWVYSPLCLTVSVLCGLLLASTR